MTTNRATPEQAAAVDAFGTGGSVKIEAGAGTGKTTTLKMLAGANPGRRGLYVAYNKAIAEDAKKSFPAGVECRTAHSLAFRAVGSKYRERVFDAPRITSQVAARVLGINQALSLDECLLQPAQLASLAQETVSRYCSSTADIPEAVHVPPVTGLDTPAQQAALAQVLVPLARKAWEELQQPQGQLRFTHDCYLKLWHLSRPTLRCDYVLFDEAQDADPVIAAVIGAQHHAQRVYVGDSCQAIYGWRGAIDAMSTLKTDHTMYLTQSFRFGPAVATEANKWLRLLRAQLRLTGSPAISSRLAKVGDPRAVLCRSNVQALQELLDAHAAGVPVAVVGGGIEAASMAKAARDLQAGRMTTHRELVAFGSWGQVQDYVENDHGGADLKRLVDLIDTYGAQTLIDAIARAVPENKARLVVSTAHKAKGREWASVRIAEDFPEPTSSDGVSTPTVPREEAMLAYVAVTRAREVLDRTGVAWVDEHLKSSRTPRRATTVCTGTQPARIIAFGPQRFGTPEQRVERAISHHPPAAPQVAALEEPVQADVRDEPDVDVPAHRVPPSSRATTPPAPRRPWWGKAIHYLTR